MVISRSFFRQGHRRTTLDRIIQLHHDREPYDQEHAITNVWGGAHRGMTCLDDETLIATEFQIRQVTEELETKEITYPVVTQGSVILNSVVLYTTNGKTVTGIDIYPENYKPSVGFPHNPILSLSPDRKAWQLFEPHLCPLLETTLRIIKEKYISDDISTETLPKLMKKWDKLMGYVQSQTDYSKTTEYLLFHKRPSRSQLRRLLLSQGVASQHLWGNYHREPDLAVNSLIHAGKISRVRYRPKAVDRAFIDKRQDIQNIPIEGQADLWRIIISEMLEIKPYQTFIVSDDAFPDYSDLNELRRNFRLLPVQRRLWQEGVPIANGIEQAFSKVKLGVGYVGMDFVGSDGIARIVSLLDVLRAVKLFDNGLHNESMNQIDPGQSYDFAYAGVPSLSGVEPAGYVVQVGNFRPSSGEITPEEIRSGYRPKVDHECLRVHYDAKSIGRDWLRFGIVPDRREKMQEIHLCHHAILSMLTYMEDNGGPDNFHIPFPIPSNKDTQDLFNLMYTNVLVETRLSDGKVRRRNLANIEMEYILWQMVAYKNR